MRAPAWKNLVQAKQAMDFTDLYRQSLMWFIGVNPRKSVAWGFFAI
jgi:hypothetical protein